MSTVEDEWEKMKLAEQTRRQEYKERVKTLKKTGDIDVTSLIRQQEAKEKTAKSSKKHRTLQVKSKTDEPMPSLSNGLITSIEAEEHLSTDARMTYQEFNVKFARDFEALSSEIALQRRSAISRIHRFFNSSSLFCVSDYNLLLQEGSRSFFKLFADEVELTREMAAKICLHIFSNSSDFVPVLGYLFPALMQRLPSGLLYDEEMKVFVSDISLHEAYRRGRAVDRQDKANAGSGGCHGEVVVHKVVETSEEVRLLLCKLVHLLVQRTSDLKSSSIMLPYFHDIVMFTQFNLSDPFPDLRQEACFCLSKLASRAEYETGMKFFAVALVRSILPVLRHRHSKVRLAAVDCLTACMIVPDRAKCKGAGTDAMPELVGFREENVIQVASFYSPDVRINHLAELIYDKSPVVRERVGVMLTNFLTELPDRYDHQTRLLPYLLDLVTDEAASVSSIALSCLEICGRQYEEEHQDEIIERRQFGIDGDSRINLSKPCLHPFQCRPRLGVRLYVRGNTKRFLSALVGELTNWQSQTRIKSANLLKVILYCCEEHVTMEIHHLIPSFIKALLLAREASDKDLVKSLLELFEITGRFVLPEVYVHYFIPRLRGDVEVVQFGLDNNSKEIVVTILRQFISGSQVTEILNHLGLLVEVLTDPFVIDVHSLNLQGQVFGLLNDILLSIQGKGHVFISAQFNSTGRLSNFEKIEFSIFGSCLMALISQVQQSAANCCLRNLAQIFGDQMPESFLTFFRHDEVSRLFLRHSSRLLRSILSDLKEQVLDISEMYNSSSFKLLRVLIQHNPWRLITLTTDFSVLGELLSFLLNLASSIVAQTTVDECQPVSEVCTISSRLLVQIFLAFVFEETSELFEVQNMFESKCKFYSLRMLPQDFAEQLQVQFMKILESGNLLERLITVYLCDKHWASTLTHQQNQLDILAALTTPLGGSFQFGSFPFIAVCDAKRFQLDGSVPIETKLPFLLLNSLQFAANPLFPEDAKLKTLSISQKIFQWFDCCTVDDVVRMKSIARRNALVERGGFWYIFMSSNIQLWRQCTHCILNMFCTECNDSVREYCLQAIRLVTFADMIFDIELNGEPNSLFSETVTRLWRELVDMIRLDENSILVELLEEVLRNLCVLHPPRCEKILRTEFDAAGEDVAVEKFSQFINHCDVLNSLIS